MTKYIAAILFGALVGWFAQPELPDYEGAWRPVTTYPMRNAPTDGRPVFKIQRPLILDTPEDLCIERFGKLPALAKRLNVPQTRDIDPSVVIEMCDGRKWDVFDILQALLDRMEKKL